MPAPALSQSDFLASYQALLPRGAVWPRWPGAVLTQVLNALMPTPLRQYQRSVNLLTDCFPATAVELLPEWEATLGLPDCCSPAAGTIQQRQAAVVSKLIATGGQSIPYYEAVAAALGWTITITEGPAPFRWTVHSAVIAPPVIFRAGESRAGDLLERLTTNTEMECVIRRIAPAHTVLVFAYP